MKLNTLIAALILTASAAHAQEFGTNELEATLDQRGARELFFLETDNSADGISTRSFLDPKREKFDLMFGPKPVENEGSGAQTPLDVNELSRSQALLNVILAQQD